MRRGKETNKEEDKIKWGKLVSFLIAIILLGVAIAFSMTQEKAIEEAKHNGLKNQENIMQTEQASSELSKTINQVKEENIINQNEILDKNSSEVNNRINEIKNEMKNEISTSSNVSEESNKTIEENTKKETNNKTEENDNKEEIPKAQFILPVEGEVIKEFAKDSLIYSETLEEWITHTGIDIKADKASIVKAVANGTVKSIKNDPRYGLTITIEHSDGYISSYSSLLTSEFVKEGEKVEQGQTIGTVGNSAVFEVSQDSHLHFELIKDGSSINPEIYLK